APPELALDASAPGRAPLAMAVSRESVAEGAPPLELRLKPGGFRLEGRVVERTTREPLAGRGVRLEQALPPVSEMELKGERTCVTDAAGRFAFEGLRRGSARLEVAREADSARVDPGDRGLAVEVGPDQGEV